MKKLARRGMNNKGFSLIELVIVVAIMAALIAILAPQYLKYVEKSRVTADQSVLNEVATAIKTLASDPDGDYTWHASNDTAITFSTTTAGDPLVLQATNPANFENDLAAALGSTTITLKSSVGKTLTNVTFTIDTAGTNPTYAVTADSSANDTEFAKIWSGTITDTD